MYDIFHVLERILIIFWEGITNFDKFTLNITFLNKK